jgi:hypothetical protein
MAWTAKHLWSPAGGSRTLCGKEARLWPNGTIFNALCTDDESAVTCKACRKIIDAVARAVGTTPRATHDARCALREPSNSTRRTNMVELNKDRIAQLETIELQRGAHPSVIAGMCAMEAAAWIAGEKHSDRPQCVSPVIAAFMRSMNDVLDDGTRQKLKPYIARCIGTRASQDVEDRRAWLAADWLVRTYLPTWLDLAGLTQEADKIRALPEITSATVATSLSTLQVAADKAAAAGAAARAAAADAAAKAAAAGAAADAAAGAAAEAAAAAGAAAGAAARAAAADAAWDAARAAASGAAEAALKPTVEKLQQSAFKLLDRMIEYVA